MTTRPENPPSYRQLIEETMASLSVPITLDELVGRVLAEHPSSAKNPRAMLLAQLHWIEGRVLVRPEPGMIWPVALAWQGARFRIPLNRDLLNSGLLDLEVIFRSYLPPTIPVERLQLVSASGQPVAFQLQPVTRQVKTVFGENTFTSLHADLRPWLQANSAYHKDHLLLTVLDWAQGVFRLEREPYKAFDPDRLEQRNRLLADTFYGLLERSRSEIIPQAAAAAAAYALLPDKPGYPPNHWVAVLNADERMRVDSSGIAYADGRLSMLDRLLNEIAGGSAHPEKEEDVVLTPAQEQQVYRLRAALKYRPEVWRELELQGQHTLYDLDQELRAAFEHDFSDHLGGFWKLVPRLGGKTIRYREVGLGDVEPFGGGEAAATRLAELDLQPGSRLKYVYDFGDWVEHILEVQAVTDPQDGAAYPREVRRSKPRWRYCHDCAEQGVKTPARLVCASCSTQEQKMVLLCEACAEQHEAEEHFLESILG